MYTNNITIRLHIKLKLIRRINEMTTTKKITKRDIDNIREFARSGYIKTASEWTTGSGRYTTRRAMPVFTTQFERSDF
nr:MAG TPA: hypothetical protein [Caudoviricetes sp.]